MKTMFSRAAPMLLATAAILSASTLVEAGGTLRLDEVAVGELDPAKASDYADSILMFNIYDTLVLPVQGGAGFAPHLSTGWKKEGNVYTFSLRSDVKFQSGHSMTAEDVVFSLDRMKALGAGLSYLFVIVDSAEALDSTTVRFNLSKPYAPFVSSLVRLPIIDKKKVLENLSAGEGDMGDWGQSYLSQNGAGTGAYRVTQHNPQQETVMAKAENYFLNIENSAPDIVRLRYGLEAATVRTLIAQGKHDIASQWLPPEVIKALADDGAQLFTESGTGAFYLKMNTTKAPLDDVNCRLALTKAFDYEAVIKLIAINDEVSSGRASTGAIPVGMFGANPAGNTLKRDINAAKKHLAQCKYKASDYTLELSWIAEVPLEERIALLMQANFTELGFKGKIKKLPWALFAEKVSKPENTPHVSQLFVNSVTGDPDTLIYGMYHSSTSGTWQSPEYLKDAKVDELLEAGRLGANAMEREQAYADLNARLMLIAPTVYAFDRQSVFAASSRVSAPALTNPDHAFGLDGMGFSFRLMSVEED